MSNDNKVVEKPVVLRKRPLIITFVGTIGSILLILATLDFIHRNINAFVSSQQKYIIAIEASILAIFLVEMLVRLVGLYFYAPQNVEHGARLRIIVRVVGYFVAVTSVISILASNATLGISVGAIAGVAIAFATQNILGTVIATSLIFSTHIVRVGEEITINQTKGIVTDINLTHTVLSIDDDVVFIPNSLMMANMVRCKKRTSKDISVHDW